MEKVTAIISIAADAPFLNANLYKVDGKDYYELDEVENLYFRSPLEALSFGKKLRELAGKPKGFELLLEDVESGETTHISLS